ncbi:AhpC/TSA antioxidant enzyme-domain-containing protein [Mariannaea sp. PMI_226]|nr:AhpC/TSA antioxidant enzyme-domain-containing protein [Mariannaea sp. PMI_226]
MGNPANEPPTSRPADPDTSEAPPLPPRPPGPPPPPYVQNAGDDANHAQNQRSTSSPSSPTGPGNGNHQITRKAVPNARPPLPHLEINTSQPEDFDGELATNNELPSRETLRKIEDYVVLDRHGKTHTFKSLHTGSNVARRVLIIFVRHFFCGNCQEYLRYLSEIITPESLLRLPVSTFIAVVGCGDPALIDMYVEATNCPFPVYTDPTRSLFQAFGMINTLALGSKPAYMRKSMTRSIVESVVQGLKQIPSGNVLKSGDQRQVGGEFLFEPRDIVTPVSTPREEKTKRVGAFEEPNDAAPTNSGKGPVEKHHGDEEKRVTWCHRMKTTRDHAEIHELMEVLGLDPSHVPITLQQQHPETLTSSVRKGQGQSMAEEIRKLSAEMSRTSLS